MIKNKKHFIAMNAIYAIILVVVITYLFLQDWRATIVPTVTIPVSLLGTFFFLYLMDMSVNTLTMFALVLVIGSVVDNAICVTENCTRLIDEEHLSPFDAAVKSMQQLSSALIASTFVVVAVYVPIMFYGGMVGTIYTQFAVTMCIALILSTVNAMTLSPALCALVLRPAKEPRHIFRWFNIGLNWSRNIYIAGGALLVRRALLTVVLFAAILYGNYHLFTTLPSSFLPEEDKGAIFCEVVLPAAATLPRTQAALEQLSEIVLDIPGVDYLTTSPGESLTSGKGENLGLAIVMLEPWDKRTTPETTIAAIQAEILKRTAVLTDAAVTAFVPPAVDGLGETGGVTFSLQATGSQNSRELAQTTNNLLTRIMETGKAVYAFSTFDVSTPMLYLDINRKKAEAMNVSISSIFNALQSQLGSYYINDFNKFGKTYQVKIQVEPEYRADLNIIEQLHVATDDGKAVPLSALATVSWTLGPRQVERFNMFPAAGINTQGIPSVSSGEMMKLMEKVVRENLSRDFQISWTNMSYQESQNEGKIAGLLLVALLMAYLFLVVMLSVATATLGAMAALKITGIPMNIYCQLGLLMLIGLMAKSAILVVEFSKAERDRGATIQEAALNGMKIRFRSVMMTALSFVIGVFPMLFASGAGAGSRLATSVTTFWGMLVATVIGMMFLPGLYAIFQRMAEGTSGLFRKRS